MSLWWLLLLLLVLVAVMQQAGQGRDGWGGLWAQLLLQGGFVVWALLLPQGRAFSARLAAPAQAKGGSDIHLAQH